jgi:hypothetical protein
MMTPKEALQADGFPVKMGKGRLSREAIERCKELAAEGKQIKGYEVVTPKATSTSTAPAAPVVNKVKDSNVKEVLEFTIYWPEESFKAVDLNGKVIDGKYAGMREVDRGCGVSLVQCLCPNPVIVGDQRVKIVPR